ncbi:MAG: hypothetical protein ACI4NA_08475 [Succinivibrio sp.]
MSSGPEGPEDYSDIINLPRHVSKAFPHMSMADRAAQFLPFDALSGFDEAIGETERLTSERRSLSEGDLEAMDQRMAFLLERGLPSSEVELTVFVRDDRKPGGSFAAVRGRIRRISEAEGRICMEDGTSVRLSDVCAVDGEVFEDAGL